ncbi:hypothetical protein [Corynebacterium rouxii]|uniref:Uncharacterized protein n=1 Tax=Corynebacterium rouxii TaxID=2719119 RepID=A0A6I8M9G1_9CORY|nr:hypothetical protein [Corynebacterium rouxii]VZH84185.1 hypothetical protein FRC0190_00221 [Corynebacterium rouxii]
MGFFDFWVFWVCCPRLVFGVEPVVFAVDEGCDVFIGVSPLVVIEFEYEDDEVDPPECLALFSPVKAVETLKAR